jgi:CHAD domain-containing protein
MSYELRTTETFGHGVRRICGREIARAIKWSQRPRNGDQSPVHQARKHLKKSRAALRLLSPVVRQEKFAVAERKLRKAAKVLSELRDAEVRFQTVRQLIETFHLQKDNALLETETFLGFELENFLAASGEWQSQVQQRLSRLHSRIGRWNTEELDCMQVRCVAQQTYRRGGQFLRKAVDRPTSESFHDFRKAAKELMYQLCLLTPLHPPFFQPLVDQLKIISEYLGNAHDLAFLGERLRRLESSEEGSSTESSFFELIELREKELQLRAAILAEKFYAEPAKDFGRHISEHLTHWEATRVNLNSSATALPQLRPDNLRVAQSSSSKRSANSRLR